MGDIVMNRRMPSPNPHFFQPLIPGFLFNFSIPKSFLKYIGGSDGDNGEKIVILRDKRKINWYVKMVGHQFKDGWKKFCKENNMQVGDFVVFKHQGHLIFDVFIFDPTACEPEIAPNIDPLPKAIASSSNLHVNTSSSIPKKIKGLKKKKKKGDKDLSKETVGFKPSGHPYWQTVNKSCYLTWGGLPIPKVFARENGLTERWCEMVLIDAKGGQPWSMTLRHSKSKIDGGGTPYIGGWRRFHQAIGLNTGDHLLFELLDNGKMPVIKFHTVGGTNAGSNKKMVIESPSKDKTPQETCMIIVDLDKEGGEKTMPGKKSSIQSSNTDETLKDTCMMLALEGGPMDEP